MVWARTVHNGTLRATWGPHTVSGPRPEIGGVGIVSVCGRGVAAALACLRDGGAPPGAPRSIASGLEPTPPVFEVPDDVFTAASETLPAGRGRRSQRIATLAAVDAFAALPRDVPAERIGVVVGTTVTGIRAAEDWIDARAADTRAADTPSQRNRPALRHVPLQALPRSLARRLGCAGPAYSVSTACTSGTQAIATAAGLIDSGRCDVVLAGGVDSLARLTYHGFASLGLLAPSRCTPFARDRAGLNLGEGAAFVLLGRPGTFDAPLARLAGWGSTADAHHATAPRPDGSGVRRALCVALNRAECAPSDVDWVHAHGTGTPTNDAVEAAAICGAFPDGVPVSSTKHVFGHTLAAAGAIATVVAVAARSASYIPGNALIRTPDPAIELDVVPPEGVHAPVETVVVNSLGFGGTNCVLVIDGGSR